LTIAQVAAAVSVHPTHLLENSTPSPADNREYVRQLRIEFACRQLSTSDTPLSEIALAAASSIRVTFENIQAHQRHVACHLRRTSGLEDKCGFILESTNTKTLKLYTIYAGFML